MYSLGLYGRPTRDEPFIRNITNLASGWRRTSRAVGGCWEGSFTIDADRMTPSEMVDFYERNLGCVIREYCAGMLAWEGYIVEMRLVLDGMEHMRSLIPDWWHNRVQVACTYPPHVDSEQGTLAYNPSAAGGDGFQDEDQDFSDWQTTSGDAVYRIVVTNDDNTTSAGFLGAAETETNTNDSVRVYKQIERTEQGWGGRDDGKTPSTYKIVEVDRPGGRQTTDWATNDDSIDEYGQMEFIETVGAIPEETAPAIRDRHLIQFAWPRSRLVGSVVTGGRPMEAKLGIAVAGFWHTLNWRFLETSETAWSSDLLSSIVGNAEFVTAGRIEENTFMAKADCDAMPQRLGDLCEDVIGVGDESGNVWVGGVYEDRKFRYEQAPTTVEYHLKRGKVTDSNGVQVLPPLLEPGFLMQVSGVLPTAQPQGTSSVWDRPDVAYVDQVEFVAPDRLRLRLYGEEEMIITTLEQARMFGVILGN